MSVMIRPIQPACVEDDSSWCARVYEFTGNGFLARHSDLVIGTATQLLFILTLAVLARILLHRTISRLIRVTSQVPPSMLSRPFGTLSPEAQRQAEIQRERRAARARAIGSVLRSTSTVLVTAVAGSMMLGELGINLGPILASAGVLGVALGFGAQNLVKDFLAGLFMLFEDQYGVGDFVDFGEASGVVEEVGLRVTTLRDISGTVWYVRNGEVLRVGNFNQGYAVALIDLPIGHRADLDTAVQLANRTFADLAEQDSDLAADLLETPKVLGVQAIGPEGITLRITGKVRAGQQWSAQRKLFAAVQEAFAEAGVPPPHPIGMINPPS